MTPKEAVRALADAGIRQSQIVKELETMGVTTTQATISRIGTGEFKNPRFDVGSAIIVLAETKLKGERRDAA